MEFEQRLNLAREISKEMIARVEKSKPTWLKNDVYERVTTLYQFLDSDLEKCREPHEIYELLKNTLLHVMLAKAPVKEILQIKGDKLVVNWRNLDRYCSLDPTSTYRKHWGRVIYDIFYGEFSD